MDELLKMWFSNTLEHLEGLEVTGKLVISKEVVSMAILKPKVEEIKEVKPSNESENGLTAEDYNNVLQHLQLNAFQLSLNEEKVVIELDVKR